MYQCEGGNQEDWRELSDWRQKIAERQSRADSFSLLSDGVRSGKVTTQTSLFAFFQKKNLHVPLLPDKKPRVYIEEGVMPDSREAQLQEVTILTRAVENVFRKLIRFLVGKISLVKLQEMMRIIYIQEAEDFIRTEDELENVSMTKLGVLTGLDTRTLSTIINGKAFRKPLYRDNHFLKELTPAATIVDVWTSEEPFLDSKTGLPKVLTITGDSHSFEALVSTTIKGRGITASSLLQRLESSGALKVDYKSGFVELLQASYLPKDINDQIGFIELGLASVANLIETVHYNLKSVQLGKQRVYQRGAWSFHLPIDLREEARSRLGELLKRTEKEAREILIGLEHEKSSGKQITSGVGMFYFEENF